MKKLSEILADKSKPAPVIEPNTKPAGPPVLEASTEKKEETEAASATNESTEKPNVAFTAKYMALLEDYGVKSITELDGEKLDEFHSKVLEAIKADDIAPTEARYVWVDLWYNKEERSWVVQKKDADDNQVGDADYIMPKEAAQRLLSDYLGKIDRIQAERHRKAYYAKLR